MDNVTYQNSKTNQVKLIKIDNKFTIFAYVIAEVDLLVHFEVLEPN